MRHLPRLRKSCHREDRRPVLTENIPRRKPGVRFQTSKKAVFTAGQPKAHTDGTSASTVSGKGGKIQTRFFCIVSTAWVYQRVISGIMAAAPAMSP